MVIVPDDEERFKPKKDNSDKLQLNCFASKSRGRLLMLIRFDALAIVQASQLSLEIFGRTVGNSIRTWKKVSIFFDQTDTVKACAISTRKRNRVRFFIITRLKMLKLCLLCILQAPCNFVYLTLPSRIRLESLQRQVWVAIL